MIDLVFTRFLISSFTISSVIAVILIIKKVFDKHITAKWQKNIGILFLIMLFVPFIPNKFFNFGNLYNLSFKNINIDKSISMDFFTKNTKSDLFLDSGWMQDFSVSVNHFIPKYLMFLLITIWLIGVFVCVIITIRCNYNLKFIKKSTCPIKNIEIEELFEKCKNRLNITGNIILGESAFTKTPTAMGIFKPYVILPAKIYKQISKNDMEYIFLHELNHYKSRDILINYIMCVFQIIYWFNPLIWAVFRQMRLEREIACDNSVLKLLDESCYIDYGMTIINFVEKISHSSNMSLTTGISGSKQQIKKRIEKIAVFTKEPKRLKIKSVFIFTVLSCLVLSQVPSISIIDNGSEKYNFRGNQVIYEDLSPYFRKFKGSFVLYDLQADQYFIYNKDKSTTRISPDSTYKIFDALIALESGIIQNENSILKWNGKSYSYESWNKDQNLESAVKNSVNWYFQDIDKRIGKKKLRSFYKQMDYGNYNISGGISDYWMESSLRISPVEQVQLLKRFYMNDMEFKKENINKVKEVLKVSEKNGSVLSGKTGSGSINGKNTNGWFIGYVENKGRTYIFATNVQDSDDAKGSVATNITLEILKDKNIY
ncbi:MAG: BlaR1 family beta-lactam sensor/signal transducer [Sebaldella sp.]|nr:BlaR1 family beta-lactam sensor/signal transducer [Sebaldella sp.]